MTVETPSTPFLDAYVESCGGGWIVTVEYVTRTGRARTICGAFDDVLWRIGAGKLFKGHAQDLFRELEISAIREGLRAARKRIRWYAKAAAERAAIAA